jgi:hypothetical protein
MASKFRLPSSIVLDSVMSGYGSTSFRSLYLVLVLLPPSVPPSLLVRRLILKVRVIFLVKVWGSSVVILDLLSDLDFYVLLQ